MALTTEQEAKIALLLEAFDGAKSIGDLPVADSATLLTALMEVVQGGVSKQAPFKADNSRQMYQSFQVRQSTGVPMQPMRQERPIQRLQT